MVRGLMVWGTSFGMAFAVTLIFALILHWFKVNSDNLNGFCNAIFFTLFATLAYSQFIND